EAFLCGFQRFVEIGLAGMGQMRQRLLGRRIEHVLALAAAAVHPLAVDIEREIGIHGAPRCSRDCRDFRDEGLASFNVEFTPPASGLSFKRSEIPGSVGAINRELELTPKTSRRSPGCSAR